MPSMTRVGICLALVILICIGFMLFVSKRESPHSLKAKEKNHPHLAKFIIKSGDIIAQDCTGFLVRHHNIDLILTAGHCLSLAKNTFIQEIHIGGTIQKDYQDMAIIPGNQLIIHETHDFGNGDFGFVQLKCQVVTSDAVHPITLTSVKSELPQELKVSMWINQDINRMDALEVNFRVINHTECFKAYNASGITVDFYGKDNTNNRPIIFCAEGDFLESGNSGTPAIATYVFGLLSRGPKKGVPLPYLFVDMRAFLDHLPGFEGV